MLRHDDDYAAAGKPLYDYDDPVALRPWSMRWPATPALLGVLKRRELSAALAQVAELSCWLPCTGQELEEDAGECVGSRAGSSWIGWSPLLIRRPGTARRYVITASTTRRATSLSTLTQGIVTATAVTRGNSGDAEAAEDFLEDVLPGIGPGDGPQCGRGVEPGFIPADSARPATDIISCLLQEFDL